MIYRRAAAQWFIVSAPLLFLVPSQRTQTTPQHRRERPAEILLFEQSKTINLDTFRAQFRQYSRGPLHTRTRRAICTGKSAGVGCVAKVTIQAIGLSKDVRADRGPLRGRVIGQIRNLDPQDITEMDSLKPASQAEYYIYLDAANNGHARWNLLEVPTSHEGIVRKIVQQEVKQCGEKPGFQWKRSDVDFASCGDHYFANISSAELMTSNGLVRLFSTVAARLRPRSVIAEDGKWYGCPWGCCT